MKVKIALIQSKVLKEGKSAIHRRVEKMIDQSYSLYSPDIIVLPEFWVGQYQKEEFMKLAEYEKDSVTISLLSSIAKRLKVYIVGGSIPELVKNTTDDKLNEDYTIYNTCYVFGRDGNIISKYRKCHLFDVNIKGGICYRESDSFGRGETFSYFPSEFGNIGLEICYDIRFPEFTKVLKDKFNCNIIIVPSNFSAYTGNLHWDILMKARAVDNNVFFIKCCTSRNYESPQSYQSYGHSQIVDPNGVILATCSHEEAIVFSELDLNEISSREEKLPLIKCRRDDLYTLNYKSIS